MSFDLRSFLTLPSLLWELLVLRVLLALDIENPCLGGRRPPFFLSSLGIFLGGGEVWFYLIGSLAVNEIGVSKRSMDCLGTSLINLCLGFWDYINRAVAGRPLNSVLCREWPGFSSIMLEVLKDWVSSRYFSRFTDSLYSNYWSISRSYSSEPWGWKTSSFYTDLAFCILIQIID